MSATPAASGPTTTASAAGAATATAPATAVGAVAGGVIGSAVSDDDNRLIAILAGAAIGAVIGNEIDKEMDDDDRACFGHSLELLEDGRRVRWDGSRPDMFYSLTPDRPLRARRPRLPPLHAGP